MLCLGLRSVWLCKSQRTENVLPKLLGTCAESSNNGKSCLKYFC